METKPSLTINKAPIVWDTDVGDVSFFGLSSVLFWANPSMYRMLAPLVEELGADLFRMLVATSSSLGTDEDYNAMVTALGSTFEEGFLAWGRAVGAAGWGAFELPHFDRENGRARVVIKNPWELRMQRASGNIWGCPFLQGKVIGIFNHAFGQSCWADEELDIVSEMPSVTFTLYPSQKTLDEELFRLRSARVRRAEEKLAAQVEAAASALRAKDDLIRSLSTPVLQVWEGVLAVPLVGEVDSQRAAGLMTELLENVTRSSARYTILDLTGVDTVDTQTASHIIDLVRAIRLLGSESIITGIRPTVAQTIVSLGVDLSGVPTRSNLRSGLEYCMQRLNGAGRAQRR